jgi:hypothetical protein
MPDGVRLFAEKVAELSKLHGRKHAWSNLTLKPSDNPLANVRGDLFDIVAERDFLNSGVQSSAQSRTFASSTFVTECRCKSAAISTLRQHRTLGAERRTVRSSPAQMRKSLAEI